MSGARSKRKGKEWEKAVAQLVAGWLGLDEADVVRARSGKDECDIGLSAEARRRLPVWLECKNHKTLSIPAWLRQAQEAVERSIKRGEPPTEPMVVFKQHGNTTPYVVMRLEHYLELAMRKEGK